MQRLSPMRKSLTSMGNQSTYITVTGWDPETPNTNSLRRFFEALFANGYLPDCTPTWESGLHNAGLSTAVFQIMPKNAFLVRKMNGWSFMPKKSLSNSITTISSLDIDIYPMTFN